MTKRLVLPACLLIAALVGYVRWTGQLAELPPPAPVQATPGDAGSALACAAHFDGSPYWPAPSDAAVSKLSIDEELDQLEQRAAVLDALSLEQLLAQAKPGELGPAVIRRARKSTHRSQVEQDVLLHYMLEDALVGGSLHRFFSGDSGDVALQTREAITRVGPPGLLELYDCALSAFPDGKPSTSRDARNRQLAQWGPAQLEIFKPLDQAWLRLASFEAARETYVRSALISADH